MLGSSEALSAREFGLSAEATVLAIQGSNSPLLCQQTVLKGQRVNFFFVLFAGGTVSVPHSAWPYVAQKHLSKQLIIPVKLSSQKQAVAFLPVGHNLPALLLPVLLPTVLLVFSLPFHLCRSCLPCAFHSHSGFLFLRLQAGSSPPRSPVSSEGTPE